MANHRIQYEKRELDYKNERLKVVTKFLGLIILTKRVPDVRSRPYRIKSVSTASILNDCYR